MPQGMDSHTLRQAAHRVGVERRRWTMHTARVVCCVLQAGRTDRGRALQASHNASKTHIARQLHKIEDKGRLCPESLYVWVYLGYEGFG